MSETIKPVEQTIITPPIKVSPEGGVPATVNTSVAPALGSMGAGAMLTGIAVYCLKEFGHIELPVDVIADITGIVSIALHYAQDKFLGVNS